MRWEMFRKPGDVSKQVDLVAKVLDDRTEQLGARQNADQKLFEETMEQLEQRVEAFGEHTDLGDVLNVSVLAKQLNDDLAQAVAQARLFNQREGLYGIDTTDYAMLNQTAANFEPFFTLWNTAGRWNESHKTYLNGSFGDIDAQECENEIATGIKNMFKTIRSMREDESKQTIVKIAESIKLELEDFRPMVPLIISLRNPGMRERHWEKLTELVGETVHPDMPDFSLKRFVELGMMEQVDAVCECGDRAAKEFALEKSLNAMKEAWSDVCFDFSEKYRTTGTYILKGTEEAMTLLDEHIVTAQAMQFSLFKQPFEEEIDGWATQLMAVSDTLDEWMKVQKSWMYLQPIFDSEDIMKQLPSEGKRFMGVDKAWRKWIEIARKNTKIIDMCATEGLCDFMKGQFLILEDVQKGLEDYLETKRNGFARFYFLSNDELLEILSQTKDPTRVQPYLCKVFEAMSKLTFTPDNEITQMISPEGEIIDMAPFATRERNVEDWMGSVEDEMCRSIRRVMEKAIEEYEDVERTDWVLQHPAQCILNGSQKWWTTEIEESFENNTLKDYSVQLQDQIRGLVLLVRGNLAKSMRTTIGALVVLDVHAKDVTLKLVDEGVDNKQAFDWISQLRYYWEEDDRKEPHLWVRCVQTSFPYGYEYLGNSFRLVITPLTDMCYMTLMGAQSLNLGGAPAGPAGTGKTETTKDLAKALAKQCVVFNCSPEMDYLMVGKFFKGLSYSGAWCCFDEFNRINIEVLSVIAQQLLQLFRAKAELTSYNDVKQLEFEGTLIKMKPTFNVYITMNPGYAGRTELPDNLSALFRPVAMMVPDYAMIGEIMLYAFGFQDARIYSKKMVTTFKLASEQLSSQDHYDYGMRAVKTTIEACGQLKRRFGEGKQEDEIVLRALLDVNVPKFLRDDLPLFENIMGDLFPTTETPELDFESTLPVAVLEAIATLGLQPIKSIRIKTQQLMDTINVRHGMMLVGPSGGGKTRCYQILQEAHTALSTDESKWAEGEEFYAVHSHIMNPKAITQAQIYGAFNPTTHEWSDGIAAELIRNCVMDNKSGSPDWHWIIFDGPVDALWIESMNTVLDDNKKLCLVSGEIIALTPQMRMMFEVEDLTVASPATVSRCGMVFMEPESLGLECFVTSWIATLPECMTEEQKAEIQRLTLSFVLPSIPFIRKKCSELVASTANNLLQSFFRIVDSQLEPFYPQEGRKINMDEVAELSNRIKSLVVFCWTWSVGATPSTKARQMVSDYYWEKSAGVGASANGLPANSNIYDFCYTLHAHLLGKQGHYKELDVLSGKWTPWMNIIVDYQIPRNATFEAIVVPTNDSVRLAHLFKLLLQNNHQVLISGNTGTGKSCYVGQWLQKGAPDNYQAVLVNFSAKTEVNQLQDLLDSKMDKRRRGVYGPPAGQKMVVFVDDLNMPQKEFFGAQPPLELVRQWMDHKGWYNRKELKFNEIIDITFVAAMGPPGGGKTFISDRLKRHFNMMVASDMSSDSMKTIFTTIGKYSVANFDDQIKMLIDPITASSIKIFEWIGEELLPTPSKSHYLFNLRDIWKVFQGICSLSHKRIQLPIEFIRVWVHENIRVFGDRLTTLSDRALLNDRLIEQCEAINKKATREEVFNCERLIFGAFLEKADPPPYVQIEDVEKMRKVMEDKLEDYNSMFSIQMPLVLFLDACDHVARFCRMLRQPYGNGLLLGVGGSGRQSLSRLASFISDYDCFQIEIVKGYGLNNFREDLQIMLMKCGCQLKVTTFLFCDTQIVQEDFVEMVGNLLSSGDVPNIYKQEHLDEITAACKGSCAGAGLAPTKANIFAVYLQRVRANLHVLLAFSPTSEDFRRRVRMFPSLVNSCTIDWFDEWPAEALTSVGKQQILLDPNFKLDKVDETVEIFKTIHQTVEEAARDILVSMKRFCYVTPTSYLELIAAYKKILTNKSKEVNMVHERLSKGLSALLEASTAVASMQAELKEKQPVEEIKTRRVRGLPQYLII